MMAHLKILHLIDKKNIQNNGLWVINQCVVEVHEKCRKKTTE